MIESLPTTLPYGKKASDFFFYGTLAMPAVFAFSKKMRKDAIDLSLIYGETLFFTVGLTIITKNTIHRIRPLAYIPIQS